MKKSIFIQRTPTILFKMEACVLEVKRQTKKKDAQMTITIPEDLAQQLMFDNDLPSDRPHLITSLRLVWDEKEV